MIKVKKMVINVKDHNDGSYNIPKNIAGKSAYEIAKLNGYTGSESDWVEDVYGDSGYIYKVGLADTADSIEIDEMVGKNNQPVYFDSLGRPNPIKYNLGSCSGYDATDDPNTSEDCVVTNFAIKTAIKDLDDIKSAVYDKAVVPSIGQPLVYNGEEQTPIWSNFDENMVEICGGSTCGTNAATYSTVFRPKAPYFWLDGSDREISVSWKIEKAPGEFTIITDSEISVSHSLSSVTIPISRLGDGEVSASSSDIDIITTDISGNFIIINGIGNRGTAIITVSVGEGTNYLAPSNQSFVVNADFIPLVDWASGTDEEIADMIRAHYSGEINLSDYWGEGDTRRVTISAIPSGTTSEAQDEQEVELTIIGLGVDTLVNPIGNKTKAAITVQTKNCLNAKGYMSDNADENNDLWSNSKRRTWCNTVFKNALPTSISSLIKPVNKLSNRYAHYNYSPYRILDETQDECFLLSEYEVFGGQLSGDTDYGTSKVDGTQYPYMASEYNLLKSVVGVNQGWWTRTSFMQSDATGAFMCVSPIGRDCNMINSNEKAGIAPAFCL